MTMKTKGQQIQVAEPELLAVCLSSPCSSVEKGARPDPPSKVGSDPRPEEQPPTKRTVAGSSPATGTRFVSPADSANHQQGLASGARPKAGLSRPTAILDRLPEESKVQNDVPQLQNRSCQGWSRQERCS